MSELANFPFVNQRADGDPNHDYDCVPDSLQAGANYLLAGHDSINGAAMKDAVYGRGYIGGTAASAFVAYLQARGVRIYAIDGNYASLLAQAHQHLAWGHPVIFTRDDPYSTNPGDSHVSVWYKDAAGSLTAMDPFGAQAITMSDTAWESHLRGNELWIMERTMSIPGGWHDDGTTLTAPNGHFFQHGFRNVVLDAPTWDPGDQPNEEEYGTPQVLLHNASVGGGTRATTRDHLLWWTSADGVHVEPYLGLELKACYDLIATLKATPPTPAPQPANVTDAISKLQGALKDLGA